MKYCKQHGHTLERGKDGVYQCTLCDFTLSVVVPDINYSQRVRTDFIPREEERARYEQVVHSAKSIVAEGMWSLRDGFGVPINALDAISLQRLLTWLYHESKAWKLTTDAHEWLLAAIPEVQEALSNAKA